MEKDSKIFVAGHNGMVGSAIVRKLEQDGYKNVITISHKDLDLINQQKTNAFFENNKPEYVFLSAAKVGGIMANSESPADFLYENMMIEMNVLNASRKNGVKKLLFLGSSCIYPKFATQPIQENSLLTGELEPTNEGYALAKISGLKFCEYLSTQYGCNYISCMPTNLYGKNDNYHLSNSHVLPALIRKFHDAKVCGSEFVTLWGDGSPLREFLYVDDLADACVFLMNNYNEPTTINVGTGKEISIKNLAHLVAKVVGYTGNIVWDKTKPNGTPRKLLNVDKLTNLGWKYKTELLEGIEKTYQDFLNSKVRTER